MLRVAVGNWFFAFVMAHWMNRATAKQLIALGSDLVRQGVQMQDGQQASRVEVVLHYEKEPEVPLAELDETEGLARQAAQEARWVA